MEENVTKEEYENRLKNSKRKKRDEKQYLPENATMADKLQVRRGAPGLRGKNAPRLKPIETTTVDEQTQEAPVQQAVEQPVAQPSVEQPVVQPEVQTAANTQEANTQNVQAETNAPVQNAQENAPVQQQVETVAENPTPTVDAAVNTSATPVANATESEASTQQAEPVQAAQTVQPQEAPAEASAEFKNGRDNRILGFRESRDKVAEERVGNALRDFSWYTEFNSYGKEFNPAQLQNSMQPQDIKAFQRYIGHAPTGIIDRVTYANLRAMWEKDPKYRDMFKNKESGPELPTDNDPLPQPDEKDTEEQRKVKESSIPEELEAWVKRNRSDVPKGFSSEAVMELQEIMKKYSDITGRKINTKVDGIFGHQTMTDFHDLLMDNPFLADMMRKRGMEFDPLNGEFKLTRDYGTLMDFVDGEYNRKYNEYVRNWNNRNQERNQKFQRFADMVNLIQGAGAASGGVKPKEYDPTDRYKEITDAMQKNFNWYDTKETERDKNIRDIMKDAVDKSIEDRKTEVEVNSNIQKNRNDMIDKMEDNERADKTLDETIRHNKATEASMRRNQDIMASYYNGLIANGAGSKGRYKQYSEMTPAQKLNALNKIYQVYNSNRDDEVTKEQARQMCEAIGLSPDDVLARDVRTMNIGGTDYNIDFDTLVKQVPETSYANAGRTKWTYLKTKQARKAFVENKIKDGSLTIEKLREYGAVYDANPTETTATVEEGATVDYGAL